MKKLNTRGFSHVEMFLSLVVVVVIGALGFYAFNSVKDRSSKAEENDLSVVAKLPVDKTTDAQKAAFTPKVTAQIAKENAGTAVAEGSNCNSSSGTGGARVQMVYVTKGVNDNFNQDLQQLRNVGAGIDVIFRDSAAKTGGKRQVRWVRNDKCKIQVQKIVINDQTFWSSLDNPGGGDQKVAKATLRSKGLNADNRKYMIFATESADRPVYTYGPNSRIDSRPGAENKNNATSFQFIPQPYWKGDLSSRVLQSATSLSMALGAQQPTAPHAYKNGDYFEGSFLDNYGILSTAGPEVATFPCKEIADPFLLDCNNDDYFNTNPSNGSYLKQNWNMANSRFLFTPN